MGLYRKDVLERRHSVAWRRSHTPAEKLLHFMHPEQMESWSFWRAVIAEFLGSATMIFVGLGAVMPAHVKGRVVDSALGFACIINCLIHIIGPTSGCHMNPAVSLSLLACGRCTFIKFIFYVTAQVSGCTAGAGLLYLAAPRDLVDEASLGMTKLVDVSEGQAVVIEMYITAILVLIVLVISDPDPHKDFEGFPPLTATLAVVCCVLCGAPYTGASLNPARSLGPAIIMNDFKHIWVYFVGPISGGLVATLIYHTVFIQGMHKFDHLYGDEEQEQTQTTEDQQNTIQLRKREMENNSISAQF